MKVIHILHELKYSGAEIMYADAAPLFQQKGCELMVLATAPELGEYAINFEQAGYTVHHKPYPPLKNYLSRIRFYIDFIKFIRKNLIDIVHIHSLQTMWGISLCTRIAGKKAIFTFHNVYPTRTFTYPYHILLRWSAKNIFDCRFQTISDSVYNHELKFYHNKTKKIYNWYGNQRYFPAVEGEKTLIREELNIPEKALVLISVGGCSSIKRHSDIIRALPIILKDIPDCIYIHLGRGESLQEEIDLAEYLEISSHIRFCGNQNDVRKYLISSDIYLMTSRFEGIPITTIEAMGCCIPSILYDVPGLRDFNNQTETCLLIPQSYTQLAEKIVFLYQNRDVSNKLTTNAKLFVDQNFSIIKNSNKIYELYVANR